ncbi:hypothetical protein BH77_08620 [Pseudomonas aeruginosa C2773C]|nr:hypothetical protein BH77_08620 [Pseudomonas aeruginosa C2773C]
MKVVMPPMLEQACRFGGNLPLAGWQRTPCIYMAAHLIDDRGRVVLLLAARKPFTFVKEKALLLQSRFLLLGLWNWRDELCFAPVFNNLLCRLTGFI